MPQDAIRNHEQDDKESHQTTGQTSRGSDTEGRPKSVYVILVAGVLSLLVLLLVVYLTSSPAIPDQPICSMVSLEQAQNAVLEGRIRGVTVAYDDTAEPPSADNWGPVLIRMSYTDGQCANLPQGITQQDRLYQLIGVIQIYNDITENQKVEIKYDRSTSLPESLFQTPTPFPTNTPAPSPTPTETPEPRNTPVPTPEGMIGPVPIQATPDSDQNLD